MSRREDGPPVDPPPPPPPGGGGGAGGGGGSGSGTGGGTGGGDDEARVLLAPYLKILRRMVRSLRAFFAAHVIVVRNEAEREIARVATGVALVVGAAMFLLASAILFATGLVVAVQRFSGLPWLESVGISLGCTLLIGATLGGLGYLRIRKPLMPESRELLQKTLDGLSQR